MRQIVIEENGIHIVFGFIEEKCGEQTVEKIKLLHFSNLPFCESDMIRFGPDCKPEDLRLRDQFLNEGFQLVQVSFDGYDRPYEKQGNKYIVTSPGILYVFDSMRDERNEIGRRLIITQRESITQSRVETVMQFYDGTSVVRIWNEVFNEGTQSQTLNYISSFFYQGITKEGKQLPDEKMRIYVPFHAWQKELSIHPFTMGELGMGETQPGVFGRSSQIFEVTNTGNWSAKKYLPLGYIENTESHSGLFWQIEHNGSWHYEISAQNCDYYVAVSGPTETQSHWFRELKPGESFRSVPVAVGVSGDSLAQAFGELTKYRRKIRRPNTDDERCPVIFNDYMNCLFGDPTTEKELPLIEAAAACGCEYYVIDAGWYSPGYWWDSVGEWQESRERFPGGIAEVTRIIREHGMVPGVWLEPEVMGIHCPLANQVPDDWFFVRHGKRVMDRSRYQLDYRNPEVIQYVNGVIDRLVQEYGVGYIKMDYNIEPGIGTELLAESAGEGMLEHERAVQAWLDSVFARYPDLVIENCSSGGLRMDYAMLARCSIQSTSDQEDYRNYATIAANSAVGVTPEQAAIWSYPMTGADREAVIFNMVNALMLRIHQSGHLAAMAGERFHLIEEGIQVYKAIREGIKDSLPYWPLGLADNQDAWLTAGFYRGNEITLAVWRREMPGKQDNRILRTEDPNTFVIPLRSWPFENASLVSAEMLYPTGDPVPFELRDNTLYVTLAEPVMARLFRIKVS